MGYLVKHIFINLRHGIVFAFGLNFCLLEVNFRGNYISSYPVIRSSRRALRKGGVFSIVLVRSS